MSDHNMGQDGSQPLPDRHDGWHPFFANMEEIQAWGKQIQEDAYAAGLDAGRNERYSYREAYQRGLFARKIANRHANVPNPDYLNNEVYRQGYNDGAADAVRQCKQSIAIPEGEEFCKAMKLAFQLGQDYWRQSDSDSHAENDRADVTRQRFETLLNGAPLSPSSTPETRP